MLNTVGVKKNSRLKSFWYFPLNGWEFLVQILRAYYTPIYAGLQIFIQVPATSTKLLSATTIMCSKCPPSAEMLGGRT